MKPMIILSALMLASIAVAQAPNANSQGAENTLKRYDSNKDSFLSKDELAKSRLANRFDELDIDHDGKLSLAELQAARPNQHRGRHGAPLETMFTRADTNKDGMLSKSEATQWLNQRFDTADTNKDGNLSKDEIRAARGMAHDRGGNR